jgi:predicted SprT family Zn-dependent metalloprotease
VSDTTEGTPTTTLYQELQQAFEHFNQKLFVGELGKPLNPCIITLHRKRRSHGFFHSQRFCNLSNGAQADEISLNPTYFALHTIEESLSVLVHEMAHQYQALYGTPGRRGYHNKEWGSILKKIGLYPSNSGQPGGREVGEQMNHYIVPDGPFARACNELITSEYRLSWMDRFPELDDDEYEDPRLWEEIPAETVLHPSTPAADLATAEEGQAAGEESVSPRPANAPLRIDRSIIPAMQQPERFVLPTQLPQKATNTRKKYRCPKCGNQVWGKPGMHLLCGESGCKKGEMEEKEA